jgi:methyl-accepting chemotaxis protein
MIATLKQGASDAVNAMAIGMERAEKAVAGAELAGSSISSITSSIQHISDMSTMVATATEEQSTVVDDLNRHITAINDISKRTADASIEAVQACDQLYASASELTALVERFRV